MSNNGQGSFTFGPRGPGTPPDPLVLLRLQVEAEYGGPSKLFEAFLMFHRANPHVLPLLSRFAHDALRAGHAHYGIGAIWERVRWHLNIDTRDTTGLKLNNNHRAYYARLLAIVHPTTLGSVFTTRQLGQDHHIV